MTTILIILSVILKIIISVFIAVLIGLFCSFIPHIQLRLKIKPISEEFRNFYYGFMGSLITFLIHCFL